MSALEAALLLEAHEPPEIRGSGRDDVALLVASRGAGEIVHARFGDLPRFLRAGDLLVVNTSGTLPAALGADWLAGAWDQIASLYVCGPSAGVAEEVSGRWVLETLGLPVDSGFGLTTGGTMANFSGIAAPTRLPLHRSARIRGERLAGDSAPISRRAVFPDPRTAAISPRSRCRPRGRCNVNVVIS